MIVQAHRKIVTKDARGKENGFLLPIFNIHDGFVHERQRPEQVYLTVIAPRCVKGPHLHMKRWGLFTCIKGNARIIVRTARGYEEYTTGENFEYRTIQVPAGVPAAMQNLGDEEAHILNMPAPAWRADEQDEHAVNFDDYEFRWELSGGVGSDRSLVRDK